MIQKKIFLARSQCRRHQPRVCDKVRKFVWAKVKPLAETASISISQVKCALETNIIFGFDGGVYAQVTSLAACLQCGQTLPGIFRSADFDPRRDKIFSRHDKVYVLRRPSIPEKRSSGSCELAWRGLRPHFLSGQAIFIFMSADSGVGGPTESALAKLNPTRLRL